MLKLHPNVKVQTSADCFASTIFLFTFAIMAFLFILTAENFHKNCKIPEKWYGLVRQV